MGSVIFGSFADDDAGKQTGDHGAAELPPVLETEQGEKIYTVYCAARVKSDDLFYNLKDAPNQAYFDQKVKDLSRRALYTLGNQPEYDQKLLTLSTCTNTGQDDRVIVVAVQNK